jgi:hypothetical protein
MELGYARCSTDQQDLTAQRDGLLALGVEAARIYVDHGLTGTNRDRPGLREALAARREGDTLVVTMVTLFEAGEHSTANSPTSSASAARPSTEPSNAAGRSRPEGTDRRAPRGRIPVLPLRPTGTPVNPLTWDDAVNQARVCS